MVLEGRWVGHRQPGIDDNYHTLEQATDRSDKCGLSPHRWGWNKKSYLNSDIMKKYILQRIVGEIVSIVLQLILFDVINYIREKIYERKNKKKHWLRTYYMIIVVMCGGKAKGLATTGGAVSPPLHKKKLLNVLIVNQIKKICYET